MWLNVLGEILLIAGVCALTGALILVRRLIAQLPEGGLRRRWHALIALLMMFILGYLAYIPTFWAHEVTASDLTVPIIFFLGSIFTVMTGSLALQTVFDVNRIAQLEHETVTDALTGLHNRRYLDRRLAEECARAERYALPLSVLLIDIDHFKDVNDLHGHQVGDLVLQDLGSFVRETVRQTDIAARFGGEEIAVIAPETSASMALCLAERLRGGIEDRVIETGSGSDGNGGVRVTLSIGVADRHGAAIDCQSIIHAADRALYEAKRSGRNRVILSGAETVPLPGDAR